MLFWRRTLRVIISLYIFQLYINGEFVGGLDIIKEMVESNELQPMIPKKAKSLEQRMKDLINSGNVMVFMKGNRNEPRCGFSRTLMEIFLGKLLNKLHLRNTGEIIESL